MRYLIGGNGLTLAAGTAFTYGGNVSPFIDIYGGTTSGAFNQSIISITTVQAIIIVRVSIAPSTAGVDNTLQISVPFSAGTVNSACLWIQQVNPTFVQNSTLAAPLFVNVQKTVTIPT